VLGGSHGTSSTPAARNLRENTSRVCQVQSEVEATGTLARLRNISRQMPLRDSDQQKDKGNQATKVSELSELLMASSGADVYLFY
jgi:hypothetical protein